MNVFVIEAIRNRLAAALRRENTLFMLLQDCLDLERKVIFNKRRIILTLTACETQHLAFVFLEQAYGVVLGVALIEHQAKAILAHRKMHARDLTLG